MTTEQWTNKVYRLVGVRYSPLELVKAKMELKRKWMLDINETVDQKQVNAELASLANTRGFMSLQTSLAFAAKRKDDYGFLASFEVTSTLQPFS